MFRAEHEAYTYTTNASDTAPIYFYILLIIFVITHKVFTVFYIYVIFVYAYVYICVYNEYVWIPVYKCVIFL